MIEENIKIITAHLNNKNEGKIDALKKLLSMQENKLFNEQEYNFTDAGLKYQVHNRTDVKTTREKLIDNTYQIFSQFYDDVSLEEFNEIKDNLLNLPIEIFPVIHSFENIYFDYGIYHIFHFIKDTKHILENIDNKKRHFYSTYKSKVLQANLKQMEALKTNKFLYPKSEFEQTIFQGKERVLSLAEEHYNMLFTWSAFSADINTMGMFKDNMLDTIFNDFLNELNAIRTTTKDAIKSLAILLFKLYDGHFNTQENELFVENVLRVFFKDEIIQINKNKKNIDEFNQDTFKVTTKEYRKDVYIYSLFDSIKIYGINDKNKYFYFYKMNSKEIMKMYFSLLKKTNPQLGISKAFYKHVKEQLRHPYRSSYMKQYPEFFEKENLNALDIMVTIFQEMKKTAPDNLK